MTNSQQVFQDHALHRATIEALLVPHPWVEIEADELKRITDNYHQRITEIRKRSKVRIVNVPRHRTDADGVTHRVAGAYRYEPQEPQGRDATIPAPDRWPVEGAPYHEPWKLT